MGLEVRNYGILITEEQSSYSKPTGARYCFIVSLLEVLHNVVAYDLIAGGGSLTSTGNFVQRTFTALRGQNSLPEISEEAPACSHCRAPSTFRAEGTTTYLRGTSIILGVAAGIGELTCPGAEGSTWARE